MKLFRSTEKKITKDKNSENVPDITEVVLVHCNANNDCQGNLRALYTFLSNK